MEGETGNVFTLTIDGQTFHVEVYGPTYEEET